MNINSDTLLMLVGRLHMPLVHFPIALILVAAVMEFFQFKREGASPSARACLAFGALGAIVAAISGWWFAIEGHGASKPDTLFQHRWGGVSVAVLASLTWLVGSLARSRPDGVMMRIYRLGLLVSAALVGYVGSLGGDMAWGQNHFSEVFQEKTEAKGGQASGEDSHEADSHEADSHEAEPVVQEPQDTETSNGPAVESNPAAGAQDALLTPAAGDLAPIEKPATKISYATHIQPIFEANCYECHGPSGRAKAGMRLSSRPELFEGDSEYWVMQPGDGAGSELIRLISLAADDEDVMPPMRDGKPAKVLTPEQISLLTLWIDQGAAFGSN